MNAIDVLLKIPVEAMPMIEAVAKINGWSPVLEDGSPNPQSPIFVVLAITIANVKQRAIERIAAERSQELYDSIVTEQTAVANAWLYANRGGN